MTSVYADASALVKLALLEAESEALVRALDGVSHVLTSTVGRIELERAIRKSDVEDHERVIDDVLDEVDVVPMHVAVAGTAGAVRPPSLRTLDAIHLATMLSLRDDIAVAYIYDERLAAAAAEYGIPVSAPR